MKKSVIDYPPSEFKKGGPQSRAGTKRDGERRETVLPPREPGTVKGTLRAFKVIVSNIEKIPH